MARLPVPGQDANQWGDVLNDYLSQSLDANGTLKAGTVGSAQIAAGAISDSQLAAGASIAQSKIMNLSADLADIQTSLNGKAPTTHSHSIADTTGLQTALNSKVGISAIDAKGDLLVGTGDNAVGRLPAGTNGHTLVANDSQTTGLQWAGYSVYVATGDDSDLAAALATAPVEALLVAVKVAGT